MDWGHSIELDTDQQSSDERNPAGRSEDTASTQQGPSQTLYSVMVPAVKTLYSLVVPAA